MTFIFFKYRCRYAKKLTKWHIYFFVKEKWGDKDEMKQLNKWKTIPSNRL